MTGALAVLFLLAVTLAIVRVAGVALRLTGMPQPVARFQAISALTGTGFTTSEAEETMHHPVRRRILTLLMFAGHLGVVSLASAVILTMTSTESGSGALFQILAILAAVVAICLLAVSKTLDRIMCDWVGRMLLVLGWIELFPYELLYEHPDGHQLCEHIVANPDQIDPDTRIVARNGVPVHAATQPSLSRGDRIVVFAMPMQHDALADMTSDTFQGTTS